jgi:hypothetical protein
MTFNSTKMRQAAHVDACMKQEMHISFWSQIHDGRHYLDDAGIDGKIISKLILQK